MGDAHDQKGWRRGLVESPLHVGVLLRKLV